MKLNSEARNFISERLASAPSSPLTGRRYFDTTRNVERYWNGTTWVDLDDPVTVSTSTPPVATTEAGDLWWDTDETAPGLTTPLTVVNGGTGATSPATARSSLAVPGIGNSTTVAGAPTTGTFARGDSHLDSNGALWLCTTAGTPGVWRISPRTYVTDARHAGPFTGSYTFNCPFKCDVGFMLGITFYSTAVGAVAYMPRIDGVDAPGNGAYMYFNEASSHKTVTTAFTLRAVAAGTHTITYRAINACTSDVNDVANWAMTMVEVP